MDQRDYIWDCVKGIAIILMVVGHSGCPMPVYNFIYLFHMGLFFFISGRFLKIGGREAFIPFIKNRIKGLYLPYVLFGLVFLTLHNLFFSIGWYDTWNTWSSTLYWGVRTIGFIHVEPLLIPFWFLHTLFIGLALTYLICCIRNKYIQYILVLVLYLAACVLNYKGITLPSTLNRDMGIVITIYLGYQLRDKKPPVGGWWLLLSFLILLLSSFYIHIEIVDGIFGPVLAYPVLTIIGAVFVYNMAYYLSRVHTIQSFFSFLGRNTLAILALHFTAFHLVSCVLVNLGIADKSELLNINVIKNVEIPGFWLVYTIFGVFLPLGYVIVKDRFVPYGDNKNRH